MTLNPNPTLTLTLALTLALTLTRCRTRSCPSSTEAARRVGAVHPARLPPARTAYSSTPTRAAGTDPPPPSPSHGTNRGAPTLYLPPQLLPSYSPPVAPAPRLPWSFTPQGDGASRANRSPFPFTQSHNHTRASRVWSSAVAGESGDKNDTTTHVNCGCVARVGRTETSYNCNF